MINALQVRVGSILRDNDPRYAGRTVTVTRVVVPEFLGSYERWVEYKGYRTSKIAFSRLYDATARPVETSIGWSVITY